MMETENLSNQLWLYKVFCLNLRRVAQKTDFIDSNELVEALNKLFAEIQIFETADTKSEAEKCETMTL